MRWLPFVSRRAYDAVCADRERIRGERDQFAKDRDGARYGRDYVTRQRDDLVRQLDECHARVAGRDAQIAAMTDRRFDNSDLVTQLERRLKELQARYDDAVGLNDPALDAAGLRWQRDLGDLKGASAGQAVSES